MPDFLKTLLLLQFLFDHSEIYTGETRHIVPPYNKAGISNFCLEFQKLQKYCRNSRFLENATPPDDPSPGQNQDMTEDIMTRSCHVITFDSRIYDVVSCWISQVSFPQLWALALTKECVNWQKHCSNINEQFKHLLGARAPNSADNLDRISHRLVHGAWQQYGVKVRTHIHYSGKERNCQKHCPKQD